MFSDASNSSDFREEKKFYEAVEVPMLQSAMQSHILPIQSIKPPQIMARMFGETLILVIPVRL